MSWKLHEGRFLWQTGDGGDIRRPETTALFGVTLKKRETANAISVHFLHVPTTAFIAALRLLGRTRLPQI